MAATLPDTAKMRPGGYARPGEQARATAGGKIPVPVEARLRRGRKAMRDDAPKRRMCMHFEKGNSYWYLTGEGKLGLQSNVAISQGGTKPNHRIRNTYNFIRPIVEAKVSAATQRIPSFDVTPSTTDPEDLGAAKLAEKVALYGYTQWDLRDVAVDVAKLAIGGGGEGYALPYFDSTVGPYVDVDGELVGQGELKVVVLSGNEVYWEPGVKFRLSRWWATERAIPIDDVREFPGFDGKDLQPDASTSDIPTDRPSNDQLVMVTDYFERPCPKYPDGRRLRVANGRVICPENAYPLKDAQGNVLDEPVLHRLVYTHDPETDRDFGLTWQLIDFQRTVQDCLNKALEYKNRGLVPQMTAPTGALKTRPTDVPGAVTYFTPNPSLPNGGRPEWAPPVQIPEGLFRIYEEMLQAMKDVAAHQDLQADPNVAARTVQAVIEQSALRWQSFIADMAEWWAGLMRHCLMLVARHYTEPRLLGIKGRFGPERIEDFRGAQLNGQVDVTVLPGSIESRSRQQVMSELQWIALTFPGYLSPQAAIAALHGGTAEKLIESYELDVARANRIIQKIRDGSVMEMPGRLDHVSSTDPVTGQATTQALEVPSWMPEQDVDNLDIWKQLFGDWAKTEDYERLPPQLQEVVKNIMGGIKQLQLQEAQHQANVQSMMAESQGMANAAKPQGPTPLPSQPAPQADPSQPPQ